MDLTTGGITSQLTGALGGFASMLPYVLFLAVLIIASFFAIRWYFKKRNMNITTIIFSERGGIIYTAAGLVQLQKDAEGKIIEEKRSHLNLFKVLFTKSGYHLNKGDWYYKLQSPKATIACPNYSHLVPLLKGNLLFLRQKGPGDFVPLVAELDSDKNSVKFKEISEATKLWGITMKDRLRTIYAKPTWFEKWGGIISIALVGVLILILVYITVQKFDVLKDVSSNLLQTAQTLQSSSIQLPPII